MMEFIRVFPQAAPLIGDLLAKNLDWPGAEQVAERLKAMLPPQAAGKVNPMVMQLQQMLQQQDAQAKQAIAQLQQEIAKLGQQVQDKTAEHQLKAGELQKQWFEAETKRMEVLKPEAPQAPEQIDPVKVSELELDRERARIEAYNAETERLKVLGATITPEAVQALVMQTVAQAMHGGPIGEPESPPPAAALAVVAEPAEAGFLTPKQMEQPTTPPDGMQQ
jgi:hypothetical protein